MEAGKEIQFPPRNTHFLTIISGYGGSVVIQIVSHTMLLLKQENIVGTITATEAKGRRSTSDENAAGVVRNKALRGNVRSGNVPFSSFFFFDNSGRKRNELRFRYGTCHATRRRQRIEMPQQVKHTIRVLPELGIFVLRTSRVVSRSLAR